MAFVLLAVLLFATACAGQKVHEPADYILEMPYKDDFRILQLSDIHLSVKDDREKEFSFLDMTVHDANPNLIVLTGDIFTFADKTVVKELVRYMEGFGIPWTITFGNHDEQGYYSIEWLTEYLNSVGGNCLFKDIRDDNVTGHSNFVINLVRDGKTAAQVIIMDSNRYNFGEYIGYDYMKEDQVDWYEKIVRYSTEENGGTPVPSVMCFHIPLPEFAIAVEEVENETGKAEPVYGEVNEAVCCPDFDCGMFDKIKELGSTKAILVGHDHVNNAMISYEGVLLCYGIKGTGQIYCNDGMLGGRVYILHGDGSMDHENIYHSYTEVKDHE